MSNHNGYRHHRPPEPETADQFSDEDFEPIWAAALAAGEARADVWYERGPSSVDCGWGWVNARPRMCRFARWLTRTGLAKPWAQGVRGFRGVYAPMPRPGWGRAAAQATGAREYLSAHGLPAGPCDLGE